MTFDQLSAADQITQFTAAAHAALGHWNILHAETKVISLRSNAVFAVTVPQSSGELRLVLRVNWPGRKSFHLINCELIWMDALGRNGVPVPEVIYMPRVVTPEGSPTEMVCTLLSYLEGEAVAALDYTAAHAAAVGQVAAQIHGVDHGIGPNSAFRRPRLDWEGLFGADSPYASDTEGEALLVPHRDVLDAVTARVAGVFSSLDAMGGQFGLIHADLKPDNVLFAAPGQPRVVDFDDCGWGYYPYDLAPLLLFLKPHARYHELKAALWQSYTAQRPMPDSVYDALETLVAGRYVASCRWVAAHRDHPAYRGRAETLLAGRAAELARFLETGLL